MGDEDIALRKKAKKDKKRSRKGSKKASSDRRSSSTSSSSSEDSRRRCKEKKKLKKAKKKDKKKAKEAQREEQSAAVANGGSTGSDLLPVEEAGPSVTLAEAPVKPKGPMTKEQWEAQRNTLRRVLDAETGRMRLVRGDGEIVEEIVSREQHIAINKAATKADGAYFETVLGMKRHK
ncbi:hypothetical protein RvY_12044 [Ramazzottius varieornatus]|uniref:ADP-ribosylation factor-like protein 6-interacting protein 4 n=1 Tax=Ramazzottius varieornatus TaxID=947166 RepID=A0A1D1VI74_RAMVA|nr:hypothetical protein RvY_12044 [Ramazzottius varieornatus]